MWLVVSIVLGVIVLSGFSSISTQSNESKKYQLSTTIGITTPNCPYCNIELSKFPGRKTKCKNCGNFIYVRTRPSDLERILIKEDEIQTVEDEWNKKNGTYEIHQAARNEFEQAKLQLSKIRHTNNISKNDVNWYMYNQQRLKFANERNWHEYGACAESMADILNSEGKHTAAINFYLESAYFDLCCQGNYDGFVSKSIIRQYHRLTFTKMFYESMYKSKYSLDDLKEIFMNLQLVNIQFPIDKEEAWKYIRFNINKQKKMYDIEEEE